MARQRHQRSSGHLLSGDATERAVIFRLSLAAGDSLEKSQKDQEASNLIRGISLRIMEIREFMEPIDVALKAQELSGRYENVVQSQTNDHVVRISRMTEPYFWHLHPYSDETFLGIEGC